MTVYWCDPYIDANVGGIHGTTETTTRTGTYAAPFSFEDVNKNALEGGYPGATLADEDEIRIKGLANVSAFLVDIGNDWYCNSYYRLAKGSTATEWTSVYTANNNQAGYAFILDPTVSERYMVANSDGVIPPYIFTGGYTSSGLTLNTYSSGPNAGFFRTVLQKLYPSSNKTLQVYLIDPDYYIDVETTLNTTYPFAKFGVDLKVTDGWTSETVRNGVCILALAATNMGDSSRSYKFNNTTSQNSYGTWFDCLNTYFAMVDTNSSNSYARPYVYTNSAGGTYAGNKFTQKYGGFIKSDGGYPNYFYEGQNQQYNDSDASSSATTPGACNNLEVGISACYYGGYVYARYGDQLEYRLNNTFSRSSGAMYLNTYNYTPPRRMDVKLGSMFTYSGTSGSFINGSSNYIGGDNPHVTFLDSASLAGYSGAESLFRYTDSDFLAGLTFPSNTNPLITKNDYPDRFDYSTSGPTLLSIVGTQPSYINNLNMSPQSWTTGTGVFYDGRTSTPHDLAEANIPLGVMLTNDSDYRNTNINIKVKTDMYLYASYGHTSNYNADVNMHFSSNSFDEKPIGLMLSSQSNNNFHLPLIYYNDSAEDNALVIQGNANAQSGYWYVKKLEIPIPKYTSENIRISINWKVDANWPSGKYIKFSVGHVSATGWEWVQVYSSNNPASTNSSYVTTTLDIPNADMPTLQLNHMKIGIDVQNPHSHVHKVYIKTVGASLV